MAALLLSTAACSGSGGVSPGQTARGTRSDYQGRLNAACQESRDANARLPTLAAQQHLTQDDLIRLARQNGEKFHAEVTALVPPAELRPAHQRLLALTTSNAAPAANDPAQVVAALTRYRDAYRALGAEVCVAGEEQAIVNEVRLARQLSPGASPSMP